MKQFHSDILWAISELGDDASSATIYMKLLEKRSSVNLARLFIALQKLRDANLIGLEIGAGTPERGGKRKLLASLTILGRREVEKLCPCN